MAIKEMKRYEIIQLEQDMGWRLNVFYNEKLVGIYEAQHLSTIFTFLGSLTVISIRPIK